MQILWSIFYLCRPPHNRNIRQGSVIDLDIDMFLKISNYEDTVRQLDIYYGIGKNIHFYIILSSNKVYRLYILYIYFQSLLCCLYLLSFTLLFIFSVKRQLLRYQSCITGLFPQVSNDKIVGSVRESIYCAAAVWSLYQAYRY